MPSKILIVEDDRSTRMGLQELLRQAGYDTIVASDFRAGRRALEHESPDLLIADLRLEGFNGLQLLHVNPRPVPTIIVTGFPDEVLKTEAQRLGAEYLVKPVPPPVLLSAIERLLAGPGRQERRRWPRTRPTADVPIEIDDVPARVIDIGYGGAQVEVFRPGAERIAPQLRVVFPVNDVSLDAELVWGTPERAGRWLCGIAVRPTHAKAWHTFVDSLRESASGDAPIS